jgi:hypothetical protein
MKFTKRSIRYRRHLERKKEAVVLLGGKVAATHGTHEVPMKHATSPAPENHSQVPAQPSPAPLSPQELARRAYAHRRKEAECQAT